MYITRKTINMNDKFILHPNTNWVWDYYSPNYKLTETPYYKDNIYLWIFEWDVIPALPFDFNVESKAEEDVNTLLKDWYWTDDNWDALVSYNNEKAIDNRPLEDNQL